jgi:hypothetical protein
LGAKESVPINRGLETGRDGAQEVIRDELTEERLGVTEKED